MRSGVLILGVKVQPFKIDKAVIAGQRVTEKDNEAEDFVWQTKIA